MKHLVICDDGAVSGLHSRRPAARQGEESGYCPLNHLCIQTGATRGAGLSSDLFESRSHRSLKPFFPGVGDVAFSAILKQSRHGVVAVGTVR